MNHFYFESSLEMGNYFAIKRVAFVADSKTIKNLIDKQ